MWNAERRTPNAECRMPNAECRFEYRIMNVEFGVRYSTFNNRSFFL